MKYLDVEPKDPYLAPSEAYAALKDTHIVFGRAVTPAPLHNKALKKDMLGCDYAEYGYMGDAINITLANGRTVAAIDHMFTLNNGLVVSYGQINSLAGDFYGTTYPISDGNGAQAQAARFLAAYNTLAAPSCRQPQEARDILAILQTEVDAVNDALHCHQDPSIAYSQLPDLSVKLQSLTQSRPTGFPSYLELARVNWDHFGPDARTSYNAGHASALQLAANGDLEGAYAMNAFADHFLEASFSAGRMRTPRRGLHHELDVFADACAKFMHDEDNAIGLSVSNSAGESWMAFGDKRALDKVAADNLKRCVAAVQASAVEIYTAYTSQTVPPPCSYKAWDIAPTLASALGWQELAPLFVYKGVTQKDVARRDNIKARRKYFLTWNWWFWSTANECKMSGWWNYPIRIDESGPSHIAPYTNFAVATTRIWSVRLYHQTPASGVLESVHLDGKWVGGVDRTALWEAAPFTPLAALSWKEGNRVRVYYLGPRYKLQEYCRDDGAWYRGDLDNMNIQAARNTSIAAFQFERCNRLHIRVYCQEEGSNAIQEFCHDGAGPWTRGATLPVAYSGTSIAASHYLFEGLQVRLYYQAEDLTIREHCWKDNRWFPGNFNVGRAPGRTCICALFGSWRGVVLDVYWMNADAEIIRNTHIDGIWRSSKVVGPLRRGANFAPAQWEGGRYIRIYYQSADDSVQEISSNNDGPWFSGVTVAQA